MLERIKYVFLNKRIKFFLSGMFIFQAWSLYQAHKAGTSFVYAYIESNLGLFFSGFAFAMILYVKYTIYEFYYNETVVIKLKNRKLWFEKIQIESLISLVIIVLLINFLPIIYLIINIKFIDFRNLEYFFINFVVQTISIINLGLLYDFLNLINGKRILNFFISMICILLPEYLINILRLDVITIIDFFILDYTRNTEAQLMLLNIGFIVMILGYYITSVMLKKRKVEFIKVVE